MFKFSMNDSHIFSSPQTINAAIGKEVRITTLNGTVHSGFIYAIDPITKTFVITDAAGKKLDIIMEHAIRTLDFGEKFSRRFALTVLPETVFPTSGDLEAKRQTLLKWLKENGIETVEDGAVLKILDYVSIEPPYDIDHCYCANTIVLERMQTIIKQMPF